MPKAHLFSYNIFPNGVITGCTQYGDMAVSLDTTDTPGFTVGNMGNPYHGPDEDLGYVIAKASSARGRTHKRGTELAPDAVSFIRSDSKTDASFVDLVNKNFNQSFSLDSSGAVTAKNYLTTNEYWTSYSTDPTFTLVMNLDSTTGVTGSTWTDISGGGHSATLNGGYGTTTFNNNQVVTLNGTSGYVLPSSFGTQLSTGFTNNVWVYPTTTSNGTIISEWGGTPPNGWTDAQIALVSGRIRSGVFDPSSFSPTGYITGPTFSANTWYNIAMTYNSTTKDLMLYINGTLNSTINGVKSNPGTLYLTLGRPDTPNSYLGGASGYFQGYVGSWKIWNGPISATNILSNYNSTKSIYGL